MDMIGEFVSFVRQQKAQRVLFLASLAVMISCSKSSVLPKKIQKITSSKFNTAIS